MKKATVTYTAKPGESKTLELAGTTLMTGKGDTVICDDALMAKLVAAAKDSPSLKVDGVSDYTPEPPKEPKPPPPHDDKHKGKAA